MSIQKRLFRFVPLLVVIMAATAPSCKQKTAAAAQALPQRSVTRKKTICCESNLPQRFQAAVASQAVQAAANPSRTGMVLIKGGTFMMGGDNSQAADDEYPKHKVTVNSFWIDVTEVTNAEFAKFIKATGYVTTAERKPDWEELKKQLPPNTPKPSESLLVPASLIFKQPGQTRFVKRLQPVVGMAKKGPTGNTRTAPRVISKAR